MPFVVDASVALKWVIQETDSEAARALLAEEQLLAPELLFIECANSLRTKARRGQITPEQAIAAFDAIDASPIVRTTTAGLPATALSLAMTLGQTAYDALYLAVALSERAVLVTADSRFAAAAQAHSAYRSWVRLLEG